jgi:nucleoside-diphosphate-sugar epimerase
MKIAVTGGLGKLGRWVVQELAATHQVTVFDRIRVADSPTVHYVAGDIEDLGQVYGALAGADAVIHLAGIPTHSIAPNEVTFRTNTMGTFNVHEAAWRLGIRRVVTSSSEAVLGWAPGAWTTEFVPAYLPIDEDHPLGAQDAYGLSKQACETIAESYTAKCGMETVLLRPPWIVSPEELHALSQTGGITPTRFGMFHYVDARDVAEACRLAVERPLTGCNVLFVGTGESCVSEPLATLYPKLMPAIGDKARALTGPQAAVSVERARQVLGWTARHSWRRN